jgi:hypothetical protein
MMRVRHHLGLRKPCISVVWAKFLGKIMLGKESTPEEISVAERVRILFF